MDDVAQEVVVTPHGLAATGVGVLRGRETEGRSEEVHRDRPGEGREVGDQG